MKFEDHFLKEDLSIAEMAFNDLISGIKFVNTHKETLDADALKVLSNQITNALVDLNDLACKKDDANKMYLSELMNKPQRWFTH